MSQQITVENADYFRIGDRLKVGDWRWSPRLKWLPQRIKSIKWICRTAIKFGWLRYEAEVFQVTEIHRNTLTVNQNGGAL